MDPIEPRYQQQLFFNPNKHPEDTLKVFDEFTQAFELRYAAQFPDPPKVSMDAAIERWKFVHKTTANPNLKPNLAQYDESRQEWPSRDRTANFLGMHSPNRFVTDWQTAQPDDMDRKSNRWNDFKLIMQIYYKPTENLTSKIFDFRSLTQDTKEAFPIFCNRVQKKAKHCQFKYKQTDCSANEAAVRDQIVIDTHENNIREEALKQ